MSPQDIEENGDDKVGCIEQQRGRPLVRPSEVRCQHSSRERHRRNAQQQEVKNKERIVTALDMRKQAVMINPHDTDEREADDEGKVGRPLPQ